MKLLTQVSISSITIPPPPAHPRGFAPNVYPHPGAFACYLSTNNFCHFWNFHYNGKNWQLTALWGLFVALKAYTFLKQNVQAWIEPKLQKSK